jgi:hypothetical protein
MAYISNISGMVTFLLQPTARFLLIIPMQSIHMICEYCLFISFTFGRLIRSELRICSWNTFFIWLRRVSHAESYDSLWQYVELPFQDLILLSKWKCDVPLFNIIILAFAKSYAICLPPRNMPLLLRISVLCYFNVSYVFYNSAKSSLNEEKCEATTQLTNNS